MLRSLATGSSFYVTIPDAMCRDGAAVPRPARALKRRAPRKKRRRGPAPAPIVPLLAFLRGRVPVWSQGPNPIGGPDPRPIFRQASNGGSFDALQRPDDR